MMTDNMPTIDQLNMIAEEAWSAYLDPEGDEPPLIGARGESAAELTASVAVVGAWNGHLVLGCTFSGSRQVAAVMLAMPQDELTNEDVGDALGEMANVLGGNVKSLLPSPSTLSLPRVGGAEYECWPGSVEVCRSVMTWRGEPFEVALLHSDDERSSGARGAQP